MPAGLKRVESESPPDAYGEEPSQDEDEDARDAEVPADEGAIDEGAIDEEAADAEAVDRAEEEPLALDEPTANPALTTARSDARDMVAQLTELRRLFYSIAEHLRETAQQQADVNDATQLLAQDEQTEDQSEQLGPLQARQREISEKSAQIQKTLRELSQRSAQESPPDSQGRRDASAPNQLPLPATQRAAETEQYSQASQRMGEAVAATQRAIERMGEEQIAITEIREPQDDAFEKMLEALALLQPPPQQQNQENAPSDQQQQQPQQDNTQDQQQQQQRMSAQQLLQLVRDREAQRRKNQQRRAAARRETVDKDW